MSAAGHTCYRPRGRYNALLIGLALVYVLAPLVVFRDMQNWKPANPDRSPPSLIGLWPIMLIVATFAVAMALTSVAGV